MKTKIIFLLMLTVFLAVSSRGQDAMLTKEETVNYLHKKIQEVQGRTRVTVWEGVATRTTYRGAAVSLKGSNIEIKISRSWPMTKAQTETFVFNPAYISSIELIKPKNDEGVGMIFVRFDKKLVTWTDTVNNSKLDSVVAFSPITPRFRGTGNG